MLCINEKGRNEKIKEPWIKLFTAKDLCYIKLAFLIPNYHYSNMCTYIQMNNIFMKSNIKQSTYNFEIKFSFLLWHVALIFLNHDSFKNKRSTTVVMLIFQSKWLLEVFLDYTLFLLGVCTGFLLILIVPAAWNKER